MTAPPSGRDAGPIGAPRPSATVSPAASYFALKKVEACPAVERGFDQGEWSQPLGEKGLRPFMLRTVADQPTLWEAILPEELRRLPVELTRIDALLDDPVFFAPFVPFFDPRIGRPSTPM